MREILFRGQGVVSDKWVYGDLFNAKSGITIIENGGSSKRNFSFIKAKTVGQFTGLKDKNDVRIFEGDILLYNFSHKIEISSGKKVASSGWERTLISFENGSFTSEIIAQENSWYGDMPSRKESLYSKCYSKSFEVIGNIHENSNLLTGEEK